MNTKFYGVLFGMAAGLAVSGSAAASSVSYFMNESNKPGLFPSGADYLQVMIYDTTTDDKIHFTITPLPALTDLTGSGIGIDKFMFNGPALAQSNIDITGWDIGNNKSDPHKFGPFSNRIANSGIDLGSFPLEFSIDAVNDTVDTYAKPYADGSNLFAARVGGFNVDCNNTSGSEGESISANKCGHATRAYFSGPSSAPPSEVPVPATLWLLVSGLLGMVGVSRRGRK